MRVFVDTNVLVAAYATHSACMEVIHHCIANHTLCLSGYVLNELDDKLRHKIKLTHEESDKVILFLRENTELIQDTPSPAKVSRDRKDDPILAAAVKAGADCLLTGDQDLLVLTEHKGIPIIPPGHFWRFETKKT